MRALFQPSMHFYLYGDLILFYCLCGGIVGNKLLKPLASVFLEPLIQYAKSFGIDSSILIKDLWDGDAKWVEADSWSVAASRLETLTKDPLACYNAGFIWVRGILQQNTHIYDTKFVLGRTYTLEKEYSGEGVLRITMQHAPNMEPPRSGVLFNLGGLNAIAKKNNLYGRAILLESQCEELPPMPDWHPDVFIGDADIFEIT